MPGFLNRLDRGTACGTLVAAAAVGVAAVACTSKSSVVPPRDPPVHAAPITRSIDVEGSTPIDFVLIQPGTWTMGENDRFARIESIADEIWHMKSLTNEGPEHLVTITKPFFMAVLEVTTDQYCAFLNDTPDAGRFAVEGPWASIRHDGDRWVPVVGGKWTFDRVAMKQVLAKHPVGESDAPRLGVDNATWEGAQEFAAWLSKRTGRTIRLPTEAEWEFAARGSEGRPYPWGWAEPYDRATRTHRRIPLGCPADAPTRDVTPDGVRNLAGSVAEWTSDWYAEEYPPDPQIDPLGPPHGDGHVLRGRSGTTTGRDCASAKTYHQWTCLGIRLVMEP